MKEGKLKEFLQSNKVVNRLVVLHKEKEKHVSYGIENPDKTFFVIRRNAPDAGLFSFVITNVGWIKYAIDHGYIPVVDMEYYYNIYITKENVGKENAWDFYFKQPCGYCLEDIKYSKNIIISSLNAAAENPDFKNENYLRKWKPIADKYLHLSDVVQYETNKKMGNLFKDSRVLGVLCRGTDYVATKPHGHPIQPDPNLVIEKARITMEKMNCDNLFLATEDQHIFEMFRKAFGTKLPSIDADRYSCTGNCLLNSITEQKEINVQCASNDRYKKGLDYAITIGLLSRCSCLVAGRTSGTLGALLLSRGYESEFLFDIGTYS